MVMMTTTMTTTMMIMIMDITWTTFMTFAIKVRIWRCLHARLLCIGIRQNYKHNHETELYVYHKDKNLKFELK